MNETPKKATVTLRLSTIAEARGMSTAELARKAGLAYNTAHGLMTGSSRAIRLDTLTRLCEKLELQPADLFDYGPPN